MLAVNKIINYELTDQGEGFLKFGREKPLLSPEIKRTIEEIYRDYGKLPMLSLVREVHRKYPKFVKGNVTQTPD